MPNFKLPDHRPKLTPAELAWLGFLRDICSGDVPVPTLRTVQAVRMSFWSSDHDGSTEKEHAE